MLNVSVPSVERAVAVQRNATPELVKAVESGKVAVSAAAPPTFAPLDRRRPAG